MGYKTEKEMLDQLRRLVGTYPTQKAAAESLGVTPGFLHDVLRGRRAVGPTLARHFGRIPLTVYFHFNNDEVLPE